MVNLESRRSWNQVSDAFVAGRQVEDFVDFGPLCPLDDELGLIASVAGDLDGVAVLDAGCGGGQNAVCLARMGAHVTALDISENQLEHARRSADEAGVDVRFVLGDMIAMAGIDDSSQQLILCAQVFPYVRDIARALAEVRRVLRPGGTLIASMDHPIRSCFVDAESAELTNTADRSYWSVEPRRWIFDGTQTAMRSYDRTMGAWVDLLREAGLPLNRILEPPAPVAVLDRLFPEDGPLATLRHIPHTLVLVAGSN